MFKAAATVFGLIFITGSVWAGDFAVGKSHERFTEAFNARDWDSLKSQLADNIVFHRASGEDVFIGPDAVIERFSTTIGAPDQWNVKFAILNSDSEFVGKDGTVVERGDFAVTAGADDSACYRGSYMMTWADKVGSGRKLRYFAWQDVETELTNCK